MARPVMIMAGGTGGHVFPALAVADELRGRGVEVVWMGTLRGLEAKVVPAAGIPLECIGVQGLRGKGLLSWIGAPWNVLRAVIQAARVLARHRPRVVLGMGGFVAGPGGVASRLMGMKLIIHEQNAIAGLTNRMLAPLAHRVFEAFPATFVPRRKARAVGNPVRASIVAVTDPAQRFAGRSGALRVLIVGGSLGAQVFNEMVPAALTQIPQPQRPEVWHQTGAAHIDVARRNYAAAGVTARVDAFIDDMAQAYGWADLVICRSGALTVSELAAAGVGSVLVPFPFAVDDHQRANAEFLTCVGAAELVLQQDLTPAVLARIIEGYFTADGSPDRQRLLAMAQAARSVAMTDAARMVAESCLEAQRV